ncbi:ER membrane protein SH3 [Ceratocystis lukuohia]|uniref:Secretory component protein SHR3 n=3 Tax=Ceratocystis TaxID=5157 RepID=A0A0F8AZ47_CERFI|nr:Secretory component protein SHR3 [Ceratocystis platani]PHH50364.1 Secretory component protein SHR3 [Ceratocystis fimbriata CBS 114723]
MTKWIDWSKSSASSNYRGTGSFATFMIIGPTCFFLGILFASFPYDYPLLWTSDPVPAEYYDQLATHLKWMHSSPPLIGRILNIVVTVGFAGFFLKLFRPSEANFLFDGASLILYFIGVAVYIANIVKTLRAVSADIWTDPEYIEEARVAAETGEIYIGREDSMRVLSASNTILALVLVGVLVLQAGQWYAEHKEFDDIRKQQAEDEKAKKTE